MADQPADGSHGGRPPRRRAHERRRPAPDREAHAARGPESPEPDRRGQLDRRFRSGRVVARSSIATSTCRRRSRLSAGACSSRTRASGRRRHRPDRVLGHPRQQTLGLSEAFSPTLRVVPRPAFSAVVLTAPRPWRDAMLAPTRSAHRASARARPRAAATAVPRRSRRGCDVAVTCWRSVTRPRTSR